MIRAIFGDDASHHAELMDVMHVSRALIFGERLGWDVEVVDGRERDAFDDCNPLYLISVDDAGAYRGSLRLLPTMGPNMIRDVFSRILTSSEPDLSVASPHIWESSRICGTSPGVIDELIVGIDEVMQERDLLQIVSVFDARMLRLLRSRIEMKMIGSPQRFGNVLCYAATFDVGTPEKRQAYKSKRQMAERILGS